MNLAQGITLSIVYGLLGMVLLIGGYFIFDIVLKKIDFNEELKKNNISVGIVIAGFLIAVAIVIAAAIS